MHKDTGIWEDAQVCVVEFSLVPNNATLLAAKAGRQSSRSWPSKVAEHTHMCSGRERRDWNAWCLKQKNIPVSVWGSPEQFERFVVDETSSAPFLWAEREQRSEFKKSTGFLLPKAVLCANEAVILQGALSSLELLKTDQNSGVSNHAC